MSSARSLGRRTRVAATLTALATVAGLAVTGAVASAAPKPEAGSTGSGDSMLPMAGNGGYNVRHYALDLRYRPAGNVLRGTADIRAVARKRLSSFSLDLQGLHVRRVVVDGDRARFRRHAHELVITPDKAVSGRFTTTVRYGGHPRRHIDADGSPEGWLTMPDGATALNEPVGAMTWFPVNNTPRDKARYTIRITAPSGLAAASNGVLARRERHGDRTTWTWRQADPMAADLALVSIGKYDVFRSRVHLTGNRRIPSWTFVQTSLPSQRKHRRMLPEILRWQERRLGVYPFRSTGLVFHRLAVGYSLETQNRPFFPGNIDTLTVVHELAHQWFGDSVTPSDLGDIWLNEGFATYVEWMWRADHGGPSVAQSFRQLYERHGADSPYWQPAPNALPGSEYLFSTPVYERGAMTLQALRERVGKDKFFEILRTWLRENRHGNVLTHQFIRLAQEVSGDNLGPLFQDWLIVPTRPVGY